MKYPYSYMKSKDLWRALLVLGIASLWLTACTAMKMQPEPPQVSVTGITLTGATLFEQQYLVQLRLQNPNNYDLPLDGFQFRLSLNNEPFLSAISANAVTLPRLGSATVKMEAVSKLTGLLQQIKALAAGEIDRVSYSITGKIYLARPAPALPFKEEGELDLSWLEQSSVNKEK